MLQLMSPIFEDEGIEAKNTIEDGYTIMADALQLDQVFINLFTNSIYAMAGNDFKKIEIGASETTERAFITVTDTGQGIDKEIEEKIFLPFFTARKQGAGIGLTLSKNIIEGHGGYLNFQVEDGRTCFTICLLQSHPLIGRRN